MASQELQKVLEILKSRPGDPKATVERRRSGMEKVSERVESDIECEPVTIGSIAAEWLTPPGARNDAVILYLHGGGYTMGSIVTHRATVGRIARASKAKALVINYRLAPEDPFPAGLDDAVMVYEWLVAQGYSPSKIVIAGDSAGGGLTLATLLKLKERGQKQPAAGIAISPWTDLAATGDSLKTRAAVDPMVQGDSLSGSARAYAGSHDLKEPLISPLYGDFRGLPPLLIQVGDAEILLDDATRVGERAKAAGVDVTLEVWPEMIHVWHAFAKLLPEGREAIGKVGEFVLARTS